MTKYKHNQGFSLLELLVGMTIAAILLGIAVPSLQNTINSNRVQSDQRSLLSDLSSGRAKAIESNTRITVCGRVATGSTCNDSNNWSNGWIIFVDNGEGNGTAGNGLIDGTEQIVRIMQYKGSNTITLVDSSGSNTIKTFGFDQRGYMDSTLSEEQLTLKVCDRTSTARFARAVFIDITGRARSSADINGNDGIHEQLNGSALSC